MNALAISASIQDEVAQRLASFPVFAGIAIVKAWEGSIATKLEKALAVTPGSGVQGLAFLVATPTAAMQMANSPALRLDPFNVGVAVVELPLLNQGEKGSRVPAFDWAVEVARALAGWAPSGCAAPLGSSGGRLDAVPEQPGAARIVANVILATKVNLAPLRLPSEAGFASASTAQ